jgi:hypothetical protein
LPSQAPNACCWRAPAPREPRGARRFQAGTRGWSPMWILLALIVVVVALVVLDRLEFASVFRRDRDRLNRP